MEDIVCIVDCAVINLRTQTITAQKCGTPTGYGESPEAAAEAKEMKEEVVFNPPYKSTSHFAVGEPLPDEEEPCLPEEEEVLKDFITETELIEASDGQMQEKKQEFTWNVHEI